MDTKNETQSPAGQSPALAVDALLAAVVRRHYNAIENPKGVDGAQMWNGQWWMPLWGCDTLDQMLADMAYAIERQQAAKHRGETRSGESPLSPER